MDRVRSIWRDLMGSDDDTDPGRPLYGNERVVVEMCMTQEQANAAFLCHYREYVVSHLGHDVACRSDLQCDMYKLHGGAYWRMHAQHPLSVIIESTAAAHGNASPAHSWPRTKLGKHYAKAQDVVYDNATISEHVDLIMEMFVSPHAPAAHEETQTPQALPLEVHMLSAGNSKKAK